MQQLVFQGARKVEWIESSTPTLRSAKSALVRPDVVSTCDMDAVALSGAIKFRPGTPLGHEGVGTVIDVGDEVRHVHPGDQVIVLGRFRAERVGDACAAMTRIAKLSTAVPVTGGVHTFDGGAAFSGI